jgi:hypothetical protein
MLSKRFFGAKFWPISTETGGSSVVLRRLSRRAFFTGNPGVNPLGQLKTALLKHWTQSYRADNAKVFMQSSKSVSSCASRLTGAVQVTMILLSLAP